jgi:hypothetical protein
MVERVRDAAKRGATDCQLAEMLGVAVSTLCEWKLSNPDFSEALKAGKAIADAEVTESLFKRACGFTGPDGLFYPPNVTAGIFWLKNRAPGEWRDSQRRELTGADGTPLGTAPAMIALAPEQDTALAALIAATRERVKLSNTSNP